MKSFFSIQPKFKAAVLLAVICTAVLINMLWERNSISDINTSFSSIYKDRLLPATYVFHLTDHLYQKRLILDRYLDPRDEPMLAADQRAISEHDAAIDTLLEDFEATYLVEREGQLLHDFQRELRSYNALEQQLLLSYERKQPTKVSREALEEVFVKARVELTQLSQIQIDVGKKLEENCQRIAANSTIVTNMDALLVIVIGLIIQALIFTSKSVKPRIPQRHELN